MTPVTGTIRFFPATELACKGSGIIRLDPRFAEALVQLREGWGAPLSPTSVCRSPQHNAAVRGHPRSLHLTDNPARGGFGTLAADLRWRGWSPIEQLRLARLAWSTGWAVGLHDGFIHVDLRRVVGLQPAVFLYGEWSNAFGVEDVTR